ncbi:MAG TPA: tetratricopeptide repeat protein [Thermoanaerobaculia bacterium]|nr:tetratricopeptide repeat protein [Thermoanaerobaculia bacterium]
MNGSRNDRSLYEFDGFRADPVRRRLSRAGESIALTPKAFSILLALLERRGQVVPKEDLIQQIWPDTFVTEANLTQNISSLRKALGERANDPRFVVTIPGQGYSFVADVVEIPREATAEMPMPVLVAAPAAAPPAIAGDPPLASSAALAVESSLLEGTLREPEAPETSMVSARPRPRPMVLLENTLALGPSAPETAMVSAWRRRRPAILALGLVLLLAVTTFFLYFYRSTSGSPMSVVPASRADRTSVAVLGFTNLSGNPQAAWLSNALTEMLTTELETGGKARLISGEIVTRARAALALPEASNMRSEALGKLHSLLGADLIVVGSYLARGGLVRLDLQVMRVPSGETVATLSETQPEADLFTLVSRTGAGVRSALGLAAPSAAQAKEAQALRPASPEAARLYTDGLAHLRAFDPRGARELLLKGVEADPKSAVIHSALAQAWSDLGHEVEAAGEAEKAVQLSTPLSKQEQLAIEARFDESKRDWNKASELYRSLWTFFPDDVEYGLRLTNTLTAAGRVPEAMDTVGALRRLPAPTRDDPRIDLAEARAARRLWDSERSAKAAKAAEIKGWKQGESQVVARALAFRGEAAQITGRLDEAVGLFRQARALFAKSGNQAEEARMYFVTGDVLGDQGHFDLAEKELEDGLEIARRLGSNTLAGNLLCVLGLLHQNKGELAQARSQLEQAEGLYAAVGDRLSQARANGFLGQLLLEQGDLEGARRRYEQTLAAVNRESGRWVQEAVAQDGMGRILARQGQLAAGRRSVEQALALAKNLHDPYRTAEIQVSLGEVTARLGDLAGAQRLFEQALETEQRLGEQLPMARIQGSLAELAYRRGDLATARLASREQLRIAEKTGAQLLAAEALQHLGRTEIAEGDLAGARQHLEQAAQTAESLGGQLAAASIRLDLARLALLSNRPAETVRLAGDTAEWYGERQMSGEQARALALLAEAFAYQRQIGKAREPAERARALAERSEDGDVQVAVATSVARIDALVGSGSGAQLHLRQAVEQAGKTGLILAGFEARLALGTVQVLSTADRTAGFQLLEQVRREAVERGFKLLAQRAELALKSALPGSRLG